MLGAFAVVATADTLRFALWTYGADTGTFVQLILDTFGGMRDGIEHGTHFRYHWSPVLALLWPLLVATHAPLALQYVQTLATMTVAPLTYLLAAPRTTPAIALRLAILTLVYPPLLAIGWGEFHEVGFATPLVIGMIVAADRRAWGWFGLCVVVLCGLREDCCLEIALAGIVLGIGAWRSRTAWFTAAALAIASDAFYYGIIIPRVGAWNPSHFYVYPFAPTLVALIVSPLLHPLAFIREFFTFGRLTYLLEAFVPLALLPLRSRWSLLALPGFAIVLLANDELVYHMGNHYGALWIGWLISGTVFAAARLNAERTLNAALGICAIVLIFFNPLHPAHFLKPNYHDLPAARAALACVPPDASVSTHDEWFTHIAAHNPHATLGTLDGVAYLVFADDYPNDEFQHVDLPKLRTGLANGSLQEVCHVRHVVTYRRLRQEP
jgi:uncharacterized membrane protein